jgi:cytidylate kinase
MLLAIEAASEGHMTAGVVTFSNQMGANGGAIARAVAEKLRYRYYDWEVLSQAAAEAGVSPEVVAVAAAERAPTFIERMMRRLAAASEEEPAPVPAGSRQSILSSEDYRQFIEHVVQQLADRGDAVIVGHAGQAILRDRAGVLRVLLTGSLESRAARLSAAQGTPVDQVKETVRQSDRQRADFFRRAYQLDWLGAGSYDVCLNTDRLSTELARDMIVACAREVP